MAVSARRLAKVNVSWPGWLAQQCVRDLWRAGVALKKATADVTPSPPVTRPTSAMRSCRSVSMTASAPSLTSSALFALDRTTQIVRKPTRFPRRTTLLPSADPAAVTNSQLSRGTLSTSCTIATAETGLDRYIAACSSVSCVGTRTARLAKPDPHLSTMPTPSTPSV